MRIALIAACTPRRVIGKNNQLPWHMPADLQYFKKMTLHKSVIMGRKTFESIGRALPNRENIVLTRNRNYNAAGIKIFEDLSLALNYLKNKDAQNTNISSEIEICILGGETVFAKALPIANVLYLTYIYSNIEGDTYFPPWSEDEWQETSRINHKADSDNPYDYSFVVLQKVPTKLN